MKKNMAEQPLVTIVIPNYRTEVLTKLCFRLLRKYTDLSKVRVVAVDNASGDASVEYLRTLPWITLLERAVLPGEDGPSMHAQALDLALKTAETPFFLVMHTDTLVIRPGWLEYLLKEIQSSAETAGVGNWKLENFPLWKRCGKVCEDLFRRCFRKKSGKEERYLRSYCSLYRTKLLQDKTAGFYDGAVAGKSLHRKLIRQGYEMKFLPSAELRKYIRHLDHATEIINPTPDSRLKNRSKIRRKLANALNENFFREILNTPELDR